MNSPIRFETEDRHGILKNGTVGQEAIGAHSVLTRAIQYCDLWAIHEKIRRRTKAFDRLKRGTIKAGTSIGQHDFTNSLNLKNRLKPFFTKERAFEREEEIRAIVPIGAFELIQSRIDLSKNSNIGVDEVALPDNIAGDKLSDHAHIPECEGFYK